MSNAARRVLELFLQTPMQGVPGVTHVTECLVRQEILQLRRLRRLRVKTGIPGTNLSP
jgi:hypothetical protein